MPPRTMEIDTGLHGTNVLHQTFGMDPSMINVDGLNQPGVITSYLQAQVDGLGPQLTCFDYGPDDDPDQIGRYSDNDYAQDECFDLTGLASSGVGEAQKRTRACESCRGLKVRCVFTPDQTDCARCAKARRECIVTLPTRKRHRRTDPRLTELQQEVNDLRATVEEQQRQLQSDKDGDRDSRYDRGEDNDLPGSREPPTKRRKASDYSDLQHQRSPTLNHPTSPNMSGPVPSAESARIGNEYADVVDKGILSRDQAKTIYDHYQLQMEKHLPCVVVGANTTFGTLRKTKPTLLLAILSVASGQVFPHLQRRLTREAMKRVAEQAICRGEKSLELVHALQILTIWHASDDPKDTTAFHFVNLAYSTAISLDLVGEQTKNGLSVSLVPLSPPDSASNEVLIERQRAWLSCFLLSGITSLPLKQQNLIRWSAHLDKSIELLSKHPGSALCDKNLCRWAMVQKVSDRVFEIASALSGRETHKKMMKRELTVLIGRLQDFGREVDGVTDVSLKLMVLESEAHARVVAMRAGETEEQQRKAAAESAEAMTAPSAAFVAAVRDCACSIHAVLDEFCALLQRGATTELNALPTFHFSRTAYCLVLLICMHFGVTGPKSNLVSALSLDLRAGHYLSRLLSLLRSTASDETRRPAQKFQLLVNMLRAWFDRSRNSRQTPGPADVAQIASLHVQPVDVGREASPRVGYRKMSVQDEAGSVTLDEDELLPPPSLPRRSSSSASLKHLRPPQRPQGLHSYPSNSSGSSSRPASNSSGMRGRQSSSSSVPPGMQPPSEPRRSSTGSPINARTPAQPEPEPAHAGFQLSPGLLQLGGPPNAEIGQVGLHHAATWPLAVQADPAVAGPVVAGGAEWFEAQSMGGEFAAPQTFVEPQWGAGGGVASVIDPAVEQALNMALSGGMAEEFWMGLSQPDGPGFGW